MEFLHCPWNSAHSHKREDQAVNSHIFKRIICNGSRQVNASAKMLVTRHDDQSVARKNLGFPEVVLGYFVYLSNI